VRCAGGLLPHKLQKDRPTQPGIEVQRRPAGQLQHHVYGLQPLRVRRLLGELDQITLQAKVPHAVPKLAQHGVQAFLGDHEIIPAEFFPGQNQELRPPYAAQLPKGVQNKALLNRKHHVYRLPSYGVRRLLR